jgi:hypothetical protein
MTEYWFAYHNNEPEALYRIVVADGGRNKGEYYDTDDATWKPSEVIDRYIYFGEIGYEQTTKEAADKFIESKLA